MSVQRWNMRAMISTVDIERSDSGMYVKYEDHAEALGALKAQRDELLAALQMALADHMTEAYLHPLRDGTVEAIRCAIANAEKHDHGAAEKP